MELVRWFHANCRKVLDHPFYRAFREGSVPLEVVRSYFSAYQHVVDAIPDLWQSTQRDERTRPYFYLVRDTVAEERLHAELWARLREYLSAEIRPPTPRVENLLEVLAKARRGGLPAALGALLAIEAQAEEVAREKERAMREFYGVPSEQLEYFRLHFAEDRHLGVQEVLWSLLLEEEWERGRKTAEEVAEAMFHSLTDFSEMFMGGESRE